MLIKLLKDNDGNITGFLSHIKRNSRYYDNTCIELPDDDYPILFYALIGRKNVKQKRGIGSINIGGIDLKDEGDRDKEHEKIQKAVFKNKRHPLNK